MILAGDFKPGTKVLHNKEPYSVIDVVFVKPGKGGAFARTKMKSLINGLVREVTYRTEEKVEQPDLEYKQAQFMYKQDQLYYFMDQSSFEEISLSKDQVEDILNYLKDQEIYTLLSWSERIITITPPIHMVMEVVDTPPGVRGDTAQGGATKSATLESGLIVNVPLFVEIGDKLKVDTRTGQYVERLKK